MSIHARVQRLWPRFLCVLLLAGGCQVRKEAVVTGYDAIAKPGEEVVLRVKVEERNWRREDIKYAAVVFSLEEGPIPPFTHPAVVADKEAEAALPFTPPRPGFYQFRANYLGGKRPPISSEFLLACYEDQRPMLVIDIDGTLTAPNSWPWQKRLPVRDRWTVETMQKLAESFDLVYVTGRRRVRSLRTRQWLGEHRFPPGPVFLLDPRQSRTIRPETYKTRLLKDFARRFPNFVAGIGNKRDDAEAYEKAGMVPLLFDAKSKRAIRVANWQQLGAILLKYRDLPPAEMRDNLRRLLHDNK